NGTWTGNYQITSCSQSGTISLANICAAVTGTAPFTLLVAQSGGAATSSFLLGSVSFPEVSATVTPTSLSVTSSNTTNGCTVTVAWNGAVSGGTLTGTLTQTWTAAGLTGQAVLQCTILSPVSHSSAVTPITSQWSPGSLGDFIQAIRSRR